MTMRSAFCLNSYTALKVCRPADSVCHLINQHLLEHPQLLWPIGWAAENSCGLNGVGSEKVQLDYQSHQLKLELRFVG